MPATLAPRPILLAAAACLALAAPAARATTTPPADSLCVEYRWLDRTSTPWRASVRLIRYVTLGTQGGQGKFSAYAIQTSDSTAVQGVDSVQVVLPWTLLRVPGFPRLDASSPATTKFRTHPSAPAGGFWAGALGAAAMATTFPAQPVDVCFFLSIAPGTLDSALTRALSLSVFGSATADGSANLTGNVRFKPVYKVLVQGTGGGSGDPFEAEP